jgi:hypothetical protein
MIGPLTPAAPRPKAPQGKAADDPQVKARQDALDLQQAMFNIEMAERAELEREREALQTLMMQFIKNEDAIMKKWIEMI